MKEGRATEQGVVNAEEGSGAGERGEGMEQWYSSGRSKGEKKRETLEYRSMGQEEKEKRRSYKHGHNMQ